MKAARPIVLHHVDAGGVGWIEFDDPGSRANVLNPASLAGLGAALEALENAARKSASAVKGIVVISAKERIFIAGADLRWLAALPGEAAASAAARAGQALFQRFAAGKLPVVCAIRGACAGGGLELALACQWRVAADAPETRIGLPETTIGAIPGWGGCVRLPRLLGASAALDHILEGRLLPAREALRDGLVDELAPAADLKSRAREALLRLVSAASGTSGLPTRRTHAPAAPELFASLRRAVEARTRGREPAPLAAIETIERGAGLPVAEALELEARAFGKVVAGAVCRNLIRVFFLREAARNRTLEGWYPAGELTGAPRPGRVARVGVVGAGLMGSGIAHWLASNGHDVTLRDVRPELAERGLGVVRALFDEGVRRGKLSAAEAAAGLGRVAATAGWDGFGQCDLIIEAAVEDAGAKRALFTEIAARARPDAILASNTSALPIEEIAGHVPGPERALGIHFFNPVSRMPLVELVLGRSTSSAVAERTLAFVKGLGKSPVVCRSSPGFLVTRVLFFQLNEAVRLWEQGVPALAIDAAMRDFGWPMGPLRLIDEVGVDVAHLIFGEMARHFPGRFVATESCGRLAVAGLRGRKGGAGSGFYDYPGPPGAADAPNAVASALAPAKPAGSPALPGPGGIVDRLMGTMAAEARLCLAEGVVRSPDEVDFAILSGAGFPAFRGGLIRWAEAGGRDR